MKTNRISISILSIIDVEEFLKKLTDIIKKHNLENIVIHVDFMANDFVQGEGVPLSIIPVIKKYGLLADVHIMAKEVKPYIDEAISYGSDSIAIHAEIPNLQNYLDYISSKGIKTGVAICPNTTRKDTLALENVDYYLLMSVAPGKGGQPFLLEVLDKIKDFSTFYTQIDGGIKEENILYCQKEGINSFVIGSYFTKDVSLLEQRLLKIDSLLKENEVWSMN